MHVVLFEDEHVHWLYPITTGRPAYAITCGGYRLIDWVERLNCPARAIVRPHLAGVQQLEFPKLSASATATEDALLLVNARLVPSVAAHETIRRLVKQGRPGVVRHGDHLAVAVLPASAPLPESGLTSNRLSVYLESLSLGQLEPLDADLPLLDYPHDVIRYHQQHFAASLEHRIKHGDYQEVAEGVFAADGATLGQFVVSDTRGGPIVLEENATVGPYCFLSGPALFGRSARVIEHAAIKDAVCLGHTTKIGGEVEASIIEPYTNKQHHGFMGHSYLGSWINLGAGTCNSDLKNTYGQVKMEYHGRRVSTGMQFVGCIIGDYAKTAINTGIFTGKVVGVCSMIYGFVTTNVPSFTNYARSLGQVTEMPAEVMVSTQQRMFVRRKVVQRECDIRLLYDMYELTRDERQLAGEPLSL